MRTVLFGAYRVLASPGNLKAFACSPRYVAALTSGMSQYSSVIRNLHECLGSQTSKTPPGCFWTTPPPPLQQLYIKPESPQSLLQTLKPTPQNPNELYAKTNAQPSTSRTGEPQNPGHVVPLLGSLQLEPGGASDDRNRSRQ